MKVGKDFLTDTNEFKDLKQAHSNLSSGIKIVGWGLFGLFAVRQITK